jgi:2,3-dihydroxybenzoate decarboxylase
MCAIGIRRHKMLQHTLSANGTKDAELRHRGIVVETATQAIMLVLGGVFDAYPRLKIILGHLGETLPFLVWRVDHALARPGAKTLSFREAFCGHFYITTSGNFSNPALLCCVMEMGIDRILFAVDWPFVGEMVLAQGLGDEDRQASWDEEGDRGAGASLGRDHAPHVG